MGQFNSRANYLLSGKIFCGECGSSYSGNRRRADIDHPEYISYRCSRRHGKKRCSNKEIRKESVGAAAVLRELSGIIFNENIIPEILDKINGFILERESTATLAKTNARSG